MSIKNFIQFKNTTFTYPIFSTNTDDDGKTIFPKPVFENFTANLEGDFVSLVGPNASGKSTLMLLASGRLKPENGSVKIFDINTDKFFTKQSFDLGNGKTIFLNVANTETEEEKNLLASFVYQNMEFESDDKVSELLETVFENGGYNRADSLSNQAKISNSFFEDVINVAEINNLMDKKLNRISKGETQRVFFAFSLLYGSKSIFMDEPFFAMEQKQKEKALEFLKIHSKTHNIPVYISMHELDLSKKYAEKILLFYPNRNLDYGTPQEVLTNDALEKSYGVPVAMLKDAEAFTRKNITEKNLTQF